MSGSLIDPYKTTAGCNAAALQDGAGIGNGGGDVQIVSVHAVVVLSVGNSALQQLGHRLAGCLGGLAQVSSGGLDVLTTDHITNQLDLTRRHTDKFNICKCFHFRTSLLGVRGLVAGVAAESPGGNELTQLVADHIFRDIDGNMLPAVVNGDGVTDEGGEDGGRSGPGLQNLLVTGLVQLLHALVQLRSYERALLDTSAHFISSLLAVSALDDELVGGVLRLTSLITHSRLAPGGNRTGTADRGAALTTTVRMVVGVHDGAADGGTDTHVTGTAGLADVDVLMVDVADLADDCDAVRADETDFAGRQTDLRILRVLGHQLGVVTGGADELCAAAGVDLDVVDDAFEYLMSKAQKGEKGQYFTPRYVIDMCVKMMNPTTKDKIIDTACGSSGFTVHSIFKVWKDIRRGKGLPEGDGFTAAERIPEETNFVRDNVFAIDFDEKTVRVARTLNLIAGDGQTNVLHLNTLDYSRWGETTKQEDWIDTYNEGFKKLKKLQPAGVKDYSQFQFDLVMANPPFAGDIKENTIISHYELGKNSAGKWQNKVGRDVLFIERNLNFLKPSGRMAIVLPQGRFNNSSDKYIREFIAERCRILAVVGLHGNVFKPHTGTKTSVLFVQKWDDELCPKKEDYPIFFATMQKPSKDNSGEKIYVKDPITGENVLDRHGHLIVDHDLYSHDGLTPDGIAEAFIEFAKKEGLSFFQ